MCPAFLFSTDVPNACFVMDEAWIRHNMAILADIQEKTRCRILLALKAFSCYALFPLFSRAFDGPLYGVCASSVDEARLGATYFHGEVHSFACAFDEEEMREIVPLSSHISFNSLSQWRKYAPIIGEYEKKSGRTVQCGVRINPEHSEGACAIYDPCSPSSRLGVREGDFDGHVFDEGINGLHWHTLCEQDAEALSRTLDAVQKKFGRYFSRCAWLNLGGGHHITREDYNRALLCRCVNELTEKTHAQIYLEPGEACVLDAGFLTATVLDIVQADLPVAILDVSPACHMPDTLEMPYDPPCFYQDGERISEANVSKGRWLCRLAGKSCLAGDVLKNPYGFGRALSVGDRLVFGDMALYSMVKTNTFNGLRLPSIGCFEGDRFHLIRQFGYTSFLSRL